MFEVDKFPDGWGFGISYSPKGADWEVRSLMIVVGRLVFVWEW